MSEENKWSYRIALLVIITTIIFYPIAYSKLGIQANSMIAIPILIIALVWGAKGGAIFGFTTSLYISSVRILAQDPSFDLAAALLLAIIAGVGGGLFGLLRDQRTMLRISEQTLTHKVEEQTEEIQHILVNLENAYESTLEGWAKALELRDKETIGHSRRVTELAIRLGEMIGLDAAQLKNLYYGALLHDIGKMGIPNEILHKPGPLTSQERVEVNQHPIYAYELLRGIQYLEDAIVVPYSHHENWDGTGYPLGTNGEMIPLCARIFAVVDNWDALTSDRPYRRAWSHVKTLNYIKEQSGKKFDPKIIEAFNNLDLPQS